MKLKKSSASMAHRRLVDTLMDGYVTWREASVAVTAAYQRWARAGRHERALAYEAYVATLDREEDAASAYQQLIEMVATTQTFEATAAAAG